MSIRTPIGRVRGLGSAKSGTEHFWHQRLTAIANVFLVSAFVIILVSLLGSSHARVHQILGSPFVAIVMLLVPAGVREPGLPVQVTTGVVIDVAAIVMLMYASGGVRSGLGVMLLVSLAAAGLNSCVECTTLASADATAALFTSTALTATPDAAARAAALAAYEREAERLFAIDD